MSPVLLDTGPLVALLNRRDEFHEWTKERLGEEPPPLLTCDAVIAESCYLLRELRGGGAAVMRTMDLTDTCLVRMTEQYSNPRLLTLDGDFRVYRRHGRQAISLIIPESR
jgi:predicted nucleic acid-binding protein